MKCVAFYNSVTYIAHSSYPNSVQFIQHFSRLRLVQLKLINMKVGPHKITICTVIIITIIPHVHAP